MKSSSTQILPNYPVNAIKVDVESIETCMRRLENGQGCRNFISNDDGGNWAFSDKQTQRHALMIQSIPGIEDLKHTD